MKALKSIGVVVFVNVDKKNNEYTLLPGTVSETFRGMKSNTVPSVYITSADLTQNFGTFSYGKLKPQDYRKIFKDAKSKIRTAKKSGVLGVSGLEEKVPEDAPEEEVDSDVITIKTPQLITLKTAKGATVRAKLLRVIKNETYVFETDKGKEIKAQLVHLSEESQQQVKELVAENSE